MSMKPYGELPWWCQLLWLWFGSPGMSRSKTWTPSWPRTGAPLHLSAAGLAELLAADNPPGEGYLATARRLTAARHQAQEIINGEYGPPVPEGEDADDDYDEPIPDMRRPLVAGRDHPSWPEVDAGQRERIGDPPEKDGQP